MADRVSAELRKTYGARVRVTLIPAGPGSGRPDVPFVEGMFDVRVNGTLVYHKRTQGDPPRRRRGRELELPTHQSGFPRTGQLPKLIELLDAQSR